MNEFEKLEELIKESAKRVDSRSGNPTVLDMLMMLDAGAKDGKITRAERLAVGKVMLASGDGKPVNLSLLEKTLLTATCRKVGLAVS